MAEIHTLRSIIIDRDDQLANASIPVTGAQTVIVTLQVRWGKRCFIVHVGNTINTAGGSGFITFTLLRDGAALSPYGPNQNQWADPSLGTEIPRLEIAQGAKLQVVATNSDTTTAYDCSARIKVEYEDF